MARAKNQNFSKGANIHTRRIIANIVLIFLTLLCLIWFYVLFVNATRSHAHLTTGFTLVPSSNLIENWKILNGYALYPLKSMINSVIIAGCSALLCTYFSTMTAYAIHAYDFKAKKVVYTFILAVMMIPTQVTALGFIDLVNNMGLMDNFIPFIIPSIAAPVTFFYMKQYMDSTLPLSIIESSRIDGAGEFRTFNQIILPIMKPAIAVQAIFTFVSSWNNYFTPALILKSLDKITLPILLARLRSMEWNNLDMGAIYCCIAFAILPVIVVYLCLSKFIVGGVTMGSVKG
ncbi:MAG: carbohydrate ABC transporter permease [Lachnospiraceae bacterium]|nr:carbohydrate ABC transporter permease [Lachnospiraceae bacterium]